MKRNFLLGITLGILVILQGCSSYVSSRPIAFSQIVEHVADAPLVVKTRNGSVEVSAEPGMIGISIEAKIVCGGKTQSEADERLALASVVAIRNSDHTLLIKPDFPGGSQNGDGASFVIKVPSSNGVEIYTSNGRVTARNLNGPIIIDTSNGRIELVDHIGPAILDTSNGGVKVTNLKGNLEVDTSNGKIEVLQLAGSADVDTSNASVFISLSPGQKGPILADSSNGSITVQVGSTFIGKVTFDTSNGKIHIDDHAGIISSHHLSGSEGTIVIGKGGPKSRLDTSNASITFVIDAEG